MINDQTPVYIDLHGGGMPGDEPPEPAIQRCWHGRERLWVVFWAYGMFGSGLVTAMTLAIVFVGLQIGLVVAPSDTDGGFIGAAIGFGLGALVIVPYFLWMTVSLWRCAPNCFVPVWGRLVRGFVVVQWIGFAMFTYNYLPALKELRSVS